MPPFFAAPTRASIEDLSATGFKVKMGSYLGNPEVNSFTVEVLYPAGTKTCTIPKSLESLSCPITDLPPSTDVIVKIAACLPDSFGCSSPLEKNARTHPARTFT